LEFRAQKLKGSLDINCDTINAYVSRWKDGTWFDINIVRKQAKKSDPLRKYYFAAVINKFMEHLGYEPEEELIFHQQLKITFFRCKPDKRGIYRKVPSVFGDKSMLYISEKKQFVAWVIRKAAEYGCYIPDPQSD